MAWTAPKTFVSNTTLTAADLNTYLRDNLNETGAAKATADGSYMISTGANAIVQRQGDRSTVITSQTTTSTSFTDLATVGPQVTVTTGTQALIMWGAQIENNGTDFAIMSYGCTGATTFSAGDSFALSHRDAAAAGRACMQHVYETGLSAGSNTITLKYRVTAGTGTFQRRRLVVLPY